MSKPIGRNAPCPCGSGKKYKHCCLGKPDSIEYTNPDNAPNIYKALRKSARFKECLHPDHSHCSEQIISAHSIQNNKVLAKIAENGKVYMPTPKADLSVSMLYSYGRKEASVFTGFCGYHDKTVFQPIEDYDFIGTKEQIFLYIYRAFALEYHKKQEAVRMDNQLFSNVPSLISYPGSIIDGQTGSMMSVNDFLEEKELFDNALLTEQYDILSSIVWTFNGFSNFAATGAEAPSLDFDSKRIQNLLNPHIPARHIYISVFPENDKTFVIIAWLKKYDNLFASIRRKLINLSEEEKHNYVNNTLPFIAENIAIRPSSWDGLSEEAKQNFGMIFYGLPEILEYAGTKFDRFEEPVFDLFSI